MKKDAFYFPHFSNARHDRKLLRMRKDLGVEGYGIFFMLLEVLREQIDFRFPYEDIDLLADEFGVSIAKIEVVLNKYELFQFDAQQNFFSTKFIFFLQPYIEKTERARQAANKRWNNVKESLEDKPTLQLPDANAYANALQMECTGNARKGKESKVKESKVNEDMSAAAVEYLKTLGTIKNYPIDANVDYEYFKILEEKYPKINIVEMIKDYAVYKLDNPLKPKDNPRSQINNSCKNCEKWSKCLKTTPKVVIATNNDTLSKADLTEEEFRRANY